MLSRLTVGQAVEAGAKVLSPEQTLGDVVSIALHSFQEDFPVLDGDSIAGVLTRANLIGGLHKFGPDAVVSPGYGEGVSAGRSQRAVSGCTRR